MTQLDKKYIPERVEKKWYEFWMENKFFHAEENSSKKPYSIVIPPPNITGNLHMGHALNCCLQDILIRWKKMQGYNVLWQPGADHAGIATQNVVERQILKEGLARCDLGREKFIDRVWKWKDESGSIIMNQMKRLGSSCDWERERFTMDEGLSDAVREVFVSLYKEGLIYRNNYIINFCPRCNTALSDLEVEHQETRGHLYHIQYPVKNDKASLIIATTRPETMLGDAAVAVNPNDSRHKNLIGKKAILPIVGRELPIIEDKYVDMEFGTGALKITPAHDPNDFEIGLNHNLPQINVMNRNGTMNNESGKYENMDRFECRKQLIEELKEKGFLAKIEDYDHSVGNCYRCKTIIEPTVSMQWFVKIKPLAEPAIKAVKDGKVRITPANWEKTYFEWMENIRDWCISRQIWWGHQIPAWYCGECDNINVEKEAPQKCEKCGSSDLTQETDVLDTWFSSALWPFSTLGWPDKTKMLKVFYPTSVIVTGFDILFFWVARMIMMGLKFMDDVPFKTVYIHALVRDAEGKKMSKSKGNIIDPLEIMEKYGTDAFRFTLAAFAAHGRDIKLSEERIDGYRNFANKLWNASRFTFMNLSECNIKNISLSKDESLSDELPLVDRWILSRLSNTIRDAQKYLEEYRFDDASGSIYQFVWHEFCDWYIEIIKPRLYGKEENKEGAQKVLLHTLNASLRLLHPFMPFITEEIWNHARAIDKENREIEDSKSVESILLGPYPSFEKDLVDSEAEDEIEALMDIVNTIRSMRGEMNILPAKKVKLIFKTDNQKKKQLIQSEIKWILSLAGAEKIDFWFKGNKTEGMAMSLSIDMEIFLYIDDLVDFEQEKSRLSKELNKVQKELDFIDKKLSNTNYLERAPQNVVLKTKESKKELQAKIEKLENSLSNCKKNIKTAKV